MENHLKQCSKEVIQNLGLNEIRSVMATGDNILTAIYVAQDCTILDASQKTFYADIKDEESQKIEW